MRMSRCLIALLCLAAALGLPGPAARAGTIPPGCVLVAGHSHVFDCDVPLAGGPGSLGAIDPEVRVIVPDAYADGADVPVVYLFHGVGDTHETWVDNTNVEDVAAGLGALIVMPNGGRNPDAGWYSDWADGSRRWETFHIDVLLPWVDASFATLAAREHRAVMGLSMGGFGAMSYAGRHPDLFAAAASFSGFLETQFAGPANGYGFRAANTVGSLGAPDERIWGDPATDMDEWSAHNPSALAREGKYHHLEGNLWLTVGTGTPGGPAGDSTNAGAYGIEHYIWHTNTSFKANAVASQTALEDRSYLGGAHDWAHWQYALQDVLDDVIEAID